MDKFVATVEKKIRLVLSHISFCRILVPRVHVLEATDRPVGTVFVDNKSVTPRQKMTDCLAYGQYARDKAFENYQFQSKAFQF